ncbi:MAG: RES family NAD+ phosphorylase [Desulfuromonadales bacterium]|nr:RES family NAD+ phosphorylase [Desulfuromonadales bacterium]
MSFKAYRISPEKYATDISGSGAKLVGGRWNPKGVALLYTSTTAALAALEVLVHVDWNLLPPLSLVEITVRKNAILHLQDLPRASSTDPIFLPDGWTRNPPHPSLSTIGKQWVESSASVGLLVPSVFFPEGPDQNLLLNPIHPDFDKDTKIIKVNPFSFDDRLRKV